MTGVQTCALPISCCSAAYGGNVKRMTVMGDAFMEELSDRGSIPLRSIPEKPLKSSVLAVFLYILGRKNRAKIAF